MHIGIFFFYLHILQIICTLFCNITCMARCLVFVVAIVHTKADALHALKDCCDFLFKTERKTNMTRSSDSFYIVLC